MKITCPNCSTTYEVGATSIAPEGRDVRCSRCGTTWHIGGETNSTASEAAEEAWPDDFGFDGADDATQEADDAPLVAEPEAEDTDELDWSRAGADEEDDPAPTSIAKSDDDWQSEIGLIDSDPDEGAAGGGPLDAETAAERTRQRRARKKSSRHAAGYRVSPQMRAAMGLVLFAGSVVLVVAMIVFREPLVRASPNLADLYAQIGLEVNLRGLEFRDLRTFREYEKGAPVLIIEGTVENIRKTSAHVPAIRLALRSGDAQEIYSWTVEPRQLRLRAGQTLRFSTRLASPPDVAADVLLRFTERAQTQTNL